MQKQMQYPEDVIGNIFQFIPEKNKTNIATVHHILPNYFLKWSPWLPKKPKTYQDLVPLEKYLKFMTPGNLKNPISHRNAFFKKCFNKINYFNIYSLSDAQILIKNAQIDRLAFFVNACQHNFPIKFLKKIYETTRFSKRNLMKTCNVLARSIIHSAALNAIKNNNLELFEWLFEICPHGYKFGMLLYALFYGNDIVKFISDKLKKPNWENPKNCFYKKDKNGEICFWTYWKGAWDYYPLSKIISRRLASRLFINFTENKNLVLFLINEFQLKAIIDASDIFSRFCCLGWNDVIKLLLNLKFINGREDQSTQITNMVILDAIEYKNIEAFTLFLQDPRFVIPPFFSLEVWSNINFVKCIVSCERYDPSNRDLNIIRWILNPVNHELGLESPERTDLIKILSDRFSFELSQP